jgi:hypothetical protein
VWSVAKGGSAIPLKFNVYAGDVEKTSVSVITFSAVKARVLRRRRGGEIPARASLGRGRVMACQKIEKRR